MVAFSRVGSISSAISLVFAAKLLSAVSLSPATMSGVSGCDLRRKRKQNVVEVPMKEVTFVIVQRNLKAIFVGMNTYDVSVRAL